MWLLFLVDQSRLHEPTMLAPLESWPASDLPHLFSYTRLASHLLEAVPKQTATQIHPATAHLSARCSRPHQTCYAPPPSSRSASLAAATKPPPLLPVSSVAANFSCCQVASAVPCWSDYWYDVFCLISLGPWSKRIENEEQGKGKKGKKRKEIKKIVWCCFKPTRSKGKKVKFVFRSTRVVGLFGIVLWPLF